MNLLEATHYKAWISLKVKSLPRNGRGELGKIAQHLRLHTSTLSKVLHGSLELTSEQAMGLCDYFGLSKLETQYFLSLVQLERAGTPLYRKYLEEQMSEIRAQAAELSKRLPVKREDLTESEKSIFYSSWMYSAVSVLCSIPTFDNPQAIAARLNLPLKTITQVLRFLIETELCIQKEGRIRPGFRQIHLPFDSPLISRHHGNWRMRAMERHPLLSSNELAFSSPMSLSEKDHENCRPFSI